MDTNIDPEVVAHMQRHYVRQIDRIADRLRKAAEDIERRKKIQPHDRDGQLDFVGSAENVVHEIQTMLGNLPLDSLISAANDAHVYARVGELEAS